MTTSPHVRAPRRWLRPLLGAALALLVAGCDGDGAGPSARDAAPPQDAVRDALARPPDTARDVSAIRDVPPRDVPPRDVPLDALPDAPAARDGGDAADGRADLLVDAGYVPTLQLERGSLRYFSLPIGSLRHAVGGWDQETETCVAVIWDYSNTGHAPGAWCDAWGPHFPYVVVRPSRQNDCAIWDYGSDLAVVTAEGCVDFAGATPYGVDLVDFEVLVTGATFTARVRLDDRERRVPTPVFFGLRPPAADDGPAAGWYVDELTDEGAPGWLSLTREGAPVAAFDRCDVARCDGSEPVPCAALRPAARDLRARGGGAWAVWDGHVRTFDAERDCALRAHAEPGTYEATFCYGRERDADGRAVVAPTCRTVPFSFPTGQVDHTIDDTIAATDRGR